MATQTNWIAEWSAVDNSNFPQGNESRTEGDDNMRITRGTIRRNFPNFTGEAVTPTEEELNQLDGYNTGGSNVENRLQAIEAEQASQSSRISNYEQSFPEDTQIIFRQLEIPPVGWEVTAGDGPGRMLRVVDNNTTGGMAGGSHSSIIMDHVPLHDHDASSTSGGSTHDHQLTVAPWDELDPLPPGSTFALLYRNTTGGSTSTTRDGIADDGNHTHPITVDQNTGSPSGSKDEPWEPYYRDVICGKKAPY